MFPLHSRIAAIKGFHGIVDKIIKYESIQKLVLDDKRNDGTDLVLPAFFV